MSTMSSTDSPPPQQPPTTAITTTEGSGMAADAGESTGEPPKSNWPFIEPQPIREDQVQNAVKFLSHSKVRSSPVLHRRAFLERKGLSREEIDEAFRRVPESPPNESSNALDSREGQSNTPYGPAKSYEPKNLAVLPSQQQPVIQQPVGLAPLPIVQAKNPWDWSAIFMAIGFFVAASAGATVLVWKVLIPNFKAWVHRIILEEEGTELANKIKARDAEDASAVAAAIAAANSAAAAAKQVAEASQEIIRSRNEDWQQLTKLQKALESNMQELTNTVLGIKSYLLNVSQPKELFSNSSAPSSVVDAQKAQMNGDWRTLSPIEQIDLREEINGKHPEKIQPFLGSSSQPKPKPWEAFQVQSSSNMPRQTSNSNMSSSPPAENVPWEAFQVQSSSNMPRRTSNPNMSSSPLAENVVKSTDRRNQSAVPVNHIVTETNMAEPWWRRKKGGSEVQNVSSWSAESSIKVTEADSNTDGDFNIFGSSSRPSSSGSRGGADLENGNMKIQVANQRGVSPPLPATTMPGTATTIRYSKVPGNDELQMLPSTENSSSASTHARVEFSKKVPWAVHKAPSLHEDDGPGSEPPEHVSGGTPHENLMEAIEI